MRFVKDYRIIGQHFLALSFEISRDSARIKKPWKRIHQRELITVFVKTNKLGTLTIYYHLSVSKERFLSPLGYAFRDTSLAIASI